MAKTTINPQVRLGFFNYFKQIQAETVRSQGSLSGVPPLELGPYASAEEIADVVIKLMRYCQSEEIDLAGEILKQID